MLRALLTRLRWPLLGGAAAALALATTTAFAGSGVGSTFNLGETNSVDAQSTLTGNAGTSPQLRLQNTGGGPALSLVVNTGVAPFKVSSSTKVGSLNADLLDGLDSTGFWKLGGNGGTTPGTNFLGTTDSKALELKVNGQRALRLEPSTGTPNVIGGSSANLTSAAVAGATVGGGGAPGNENRVTADFGAIGGGLDNVAANKATVGGGLSSIATGLFSTVGGGTGNEASGLESVVAGGATNFAKSEDDTVGGGSTNAATGSFAATIAGGANNTAFGSQSSIGGGLENQAQGTSSTVAGGEGNIASGERSTIPGGVSNVAFGNFSFAAGRRAKANHAGAFVWADSTDADFSSTGNDQFDVRASGGARFQANVDVTGAITREYSTGTSTQATPLAYGEVASGGGVVATSGTPNVSSTFDSVNKRYVITITGETYDTIHHTTVVTPVSANPRVVSTTASGGNLLVKIFDLTGAPVQAAFQFVTYKP